MTESSRVTQKLLVQGSEVLNLWFSVTETKTRCLLCLHYNAGRFSAIKLLYCSYADVASSVEVFPFIRLQTVASCPSERRIFWLTSQSASSQTSHKEIWLKTVTQITRFTFWSDRPRGFISTWSVVRPLFCDSLKTSVTQPCEKRF